MSVSWQLVGYQDIPRFRREKERMEWVSEKGGVEEHNQTAVLYNETCLLVDHCMIMALDGFIRDL